LQGTFRAVVFHRLLPQPSHDDRTEHEIVVQHVGCYQTGAKQQNGISHLGPRILEPHQSDGDTGERGEACL